MLGLGFAGAEALLSSEYVFLLLVTTIVIYWYLPMSLYLHCEAVVQFVYDRRLVVILDDKHCFVSKVGKKASKQRSEVRQMFPRRW